MKKQTAVEWLALRYHHRQGYLSLEDIVEAKKMEKEQIKKTYIDGSYTGCGCYDYIEDNDAEQYYNETLWNKQIV